MDGRTCSSSAVLPHLLGPCLLVVCCPGDARLWCCWRVGGCAAAAVHAVLPSNPQCPPAACCAPHSMHQGRLPGITAATVCTVMVACGIRPPGRAAGVAGAMNWYLVWDGLHVPRGEVAWHAVCAVILCLAFYTAGALQCLVLYFYKCWASGSCCCCHGLRVRGIWMGSQPPLHTTILWHCSHGWFFVLKLMSVPRVGCVHCSATLRECDEPVPLPWLVFDSFCYQLLVHLCAVLRAWCIGSMRECVCIIFLCLAPTGVCIMESEPSIHEPFCTLGHGPAAAPWCSSSAAMWHAQPCVCSLRHWARWWDAYAPHCAAPSASRVPQPALLSTGCVLPEAVHVHIMCALPCWPVAAAVNK